MSKSNKRVKQMIQDVFDVDCWWWINNKIYQESPCKDDVDKAFYGHFADKKMYSTVSIKGSEM